METLLDQKFMHDPTEYENVGVKFCKMEIKHLLGDSHMEGETHCI